MAEFRKLQDLRGRAVINIENGEHIGTFDDIRIAPDSKTPLGIVTYKGGLFNRDVRTVPADSVQVWGKDVILVRGDTTAGRLGDAERWISALDNIRGHTVVSTDGMRVGQVNDVLIDDQGQLAGLELGQVFVTGPLANSRLLLAEAIRTLGKDVIIADLAGISAAAPADPGEETTRPSGRVENRVGNYPAP